MSEKNIAIYPVLYAGPISYYAYFISNPGTQDLYEHFGKQSFRNRTKIYGANGVITLSIPVKGHSQKLPVSEVEISNTEAWQRNHWKTLISAYKSSPYFEYYTHLFEPIFHKKFEHLIAFNLAIHNIVLHCLQLDIPNKFTDSFHPIAKNDFRYLFNSKTTPFNPALFDEYQQVFSYSNDFEPDLSILDALFNLGPETEGYLNKLSKSL